MTVEKLKAEDIIDTIAQAHYNYYSSIKYATTNPHSHDFYEIFLITGGSVNHIVNNVKFKLYEGALVFIRPEDVHAYEKNEENDMQFINIAFLQSTMNSIFSFLEEGFHPETLLDTPTPPVAFLNKNEKHLLQQRMEKLNLIPVNEKLRKRTEYRLLILEMITDFFKEKRVYNELALPMWLKQILYEIDKKENFTSGVTSLVEISGKSHEHLCRSFKKYMNVSPTEYINNIRLNYAANLLSFTDTDIITVSFESGFGNLSHFNHLFKDKFGVSPSSFRRDTIRSVIKERISRI
jgi:AraC family transcriptional regulator, dual regulator of chb operon